MKEKMGEHAGFWPPHSFRPCGGRGIRPLPPIAIGGRRGARGEKKRDFCVLLALRQCARLAGRGRAEQVCRVCVKLAGAAQSILQDPILRKARTFWDILNCAKPSREKGDTCCLLRDLGGLCVWMALICDCVL